MSGAALGLGPGVSRVCSSWVAYEPTRHQQLGRTDGETLVFEAKSAPKSGSLGSFGWRLRSFSSIPIGAGSTQRISFVRQQETNLDANVTLHALAALSETTNIIATTGPGTPPRRFSIDRQDCPNRLSSGGRARACGETANSFI